MADAAHTATDKELEKMERELSAIYSRAEKELAEKADNYFSRFEEMDAAKRKLVDAGTLSEKDYQTWRQNKIMTGRHWTTMKEQVAQELAQADKTALEYINGRLPGVYALNYNATAAGIEGVAMGYSFELVDASTVKNLATADRKLLPYKHLDIPKDMRWNMQNFQSEVLQGVVQGESMPDIAKRIFPEIMSKTDTTGKTAQEIKGIIKKNKEAAMRNARTMVTSAENKGRMDSFHRAQEMGIQMKKIWIAAHDSRTRDAHAELDGEEADVDELFVNSIGEIMFPGDPDAHPANVYNCRCALGSKILGFKTKDIPSETLGDSKLWNRDDFTLMRDATQDIVDEGEYSHYGLRVQDKDTEKIGETITHQSKNFGGDFDDLSDRSEVLNGVSTIGIDNVNEVTKYGGYEGRVMYLVGSDSYEYGYDPGERIMGDAVVLAKGKIENGELKIIERVEISGNTEVIENTAENVIANTVANEAMQEYLDFKNKMIRKYGEDNIWRDMTDAEMDMFERLERKAYTGK